MVKRGWDPTTGEVLPVVEFEPRFVDKAHLGELSNLWATSRTACAGGVAWNKSYRRKLWTSAEFAKTHDYVTSTGVYKDLDAMLVFGGR